jgi:serine/threonine-protein kinase
MERLIMKSLAKSPDDRPQTAEQFRAELIAIDKERRAAPPRRAHSATSRPRVTPPEDIATRITSHPSQNPWSVEATQRADAAQLRGLSPSGQRDRAPPPVVQVATAISDPNRGRERVDRTRQFDHPDRVKLRRRSSGGLAFKVLTVILVCAAMAVAGVFIYQAAFQKAAPEVYLPPPNAPVKQADNGESGEVERLYQHQVPATRDTAGAARLSLEGDRAWARGARDEAIARYRSAFALDPDPQTSLKLGELYLQKNEKAEAKGWFGRHQHDAPDSKAVGYISEVAP